MADVLRIKRRNTGTAGAPSSLANAELAYNEVNHTLYYGEGTGGSGGSATTVVPIAGSGAFLPLGGGVLTGPVTLSADPAAALQPATRQYVDARVGWTVAKTISAAGTTQATAAQVINGGWIITGGTGGVAMQTTGGTIMVLNASTVSQLIYPMTGASLIINGVTRPVNTSLTLPVGTTAWLMAVSATQVYVAGVGPIPLIF